MTPTEQVQPQKKKTPVIVTWVSLVTALLIVVSEESTSGNSGAESIAHMLGGGLVVFLAIYFVLWLVCKALRKLAGDDNGRAAKITYIVIGILLVLINAEAGSSSVASLDEGLPQCASERAKEAIKSTLENNAASNLVNIKLLDVGDLRELPTEDATVEQRCIGEVVTNAGRSYIRYTFTFAKSDSSQVLIEVEELSEDLYWHNKQTAQSWEEEKKEKAATGGSDQ